MHMHVIPGGKFFSQDKNTQRKSPTEVVTLGNQQNGIGQPMYQTSNQNSQFGMLTAGGRNCLRHQLWRIVDKIRSWE